MLSSLTFEKHTKNLNDVFLSRKRWSEFSLFFLFYFFTFLFLVFVFWWSLSSNLLFWKGGDFKVSFNLKNGSFDPESKKRGKQNKSKKENIKPNLKIRLFDEPKNKIWVPLIPLNTFIQNKKNHLCIWFNSICFLFWILFSCYFQSTKKFT